MRKYIYLAVFLVVCAGAWYAYHEYTRKPATAGDLNADFTLTAEELQKDFESNEDAASKKYMDKVIEVSGTVSGVSTNEKRTDISLETPDPMTAITIQVLPDEKEKAARLKEGAKVKLKGICTGKLTDIELNKGIIIE
jgi:hypothetical protein